jgi:L-fuconolactonase
MDMATRIDAHHHCWRMARGDYGWLDAPSPALAPLRRDFEPTDYEPLRERYGVGQTVVIQAAPTTGETEHLLALAAGTPWIAGVVGWADLADTASIETLERWATNPVFKGVRPMLQDLPDPGWITTAPQPRVIDALERLGLRLDALVRPQHLPALMQFVQRHPQLPVVVDHGAKPPIGTGELPSSWRTHIAELARQPQVCCKFSGLLTEMPGSGASLRQQIDAVRPVWNHLLDCFGASRLMWGSDWPVLNLAADYSRWTAVCEALFASLPAADQARVWWRNAADFYGLPLERTA